MIKKHYISLLLIATIILVSCNSATSQAENDLAVMNAPAGTTELVEKTMIYKYASDELKLKSTSTFTFNDEGKFLTHKQVFPEGQTISQNYTYDDQGRLSKIVDRNSNYDQEIIKTYSYEGTNPLVIKVTVENGQNYVPKIVQHFEGDKKTVEEIYNNDNVLRERTEFGDDMQTITYYTNDGKLSSKRVKQFKNGVEVKSTTYDADGNPTRGVEYELDNNGNQIRSWMLDQDMNRDRESYGYYYTYDNDAWVLRVSREIRDYGSGMVANLAVREIKGETNASISEDEVIKELKKIKID
ncbi:hypothetical protein AAU57_05600 [Nonlabens sp. YIK11]|uniref:hypothetical protein n=1 Tax=Nonlabens sp. YIK11 TaxID=1453349 RepID=UPI0006DD17A8|nr:hypothetical protein [Nonlabens sp. YIK11]KQC32845.1 hypothetical protein AAU57_05600 [Nonlabens sp. YIK11]